ncbi:MAG: lysophospholipid acyltransferase family protein [Erysipelotrichaceae bacterium]|nr:lysophospholipid acyltransferase family protein [Erysipelotrichaceae bacterium]
MKHLWLRWLIKFTGFLFDAVYLRRKVYYEDRTKQKRRLKGGVLLISNHRSWWDFFTYVFLFPFHLIRPVVSYEMYHKSKGLQFLLNAFGAIPLSKNPYDFSWMDKVENELQKGHKVLLFPEAHFIPNDDLSTFYTSYVRIALDTKTPILPLYTNGCYGLKKRNRVMIGVPMDITSLTQKEKSEHDKRHVGNDLVRTRILTLRNATHRREKASWFSFQNLGQDLARIGLYCHSWIWFRLKLDHREDKRYLKKEGDYIIVSNHTHFRDPLILIRLFWRRRVFVLTADVVFGIPKEKKLRAFALRHIGCIKIVRGTMDLAAIHACSHILQSGRPLIVFPEGHIQRDETLSGFRDGAALIAARNQSPILPIYLKYPQHWWGRVHVTFGPLLPPPESNTMKSIQATTKEVMQSLQTLESKAKENA